jgi:dipeptidyl aminopeptidase/acylaminoacyl peptidase
MPLPITVVCEPPPFLARTWRIWVLVGGLAVTASAFLFFFVGLPTGPGPEAGGATLRVESDPPRAAVEIDGRARGHTPLTVAVAPGERRVTLRRPGYAEATYTVRLETGQSGTLAGELWLRRPEVRRLRPAFPGAAIAGATFLDDGRIALAVALPPGDERQVWLLDGQGSARRVGPPQTWGSIAISPDGARVAYLARGEGAGPGGPLRELWLAGSGGERGSRRFVLPTGDERLVDLSWAPDSQHLLVVSREQRAGGGQRTRLRLLEVTTGEARELASLPSAVVPGSYVWSPDASRVALLTRVGQLTSLCLLGIDSDFRYLADLGRDEPATLPFPPLAWSPDGGHLLYAAPAQDRPAATGWLFGSQPATALFTAEAARPLPRPVPDARGQAPVWRADGSVLVLASGAGGTLTVRQIEPGREPREVAQLPIRAGSAFAARWDTAHAQTLVAVPDAASLGSSQPEYWLVRFRPEMGP